MIEIVAICRQKQIWFFFWYDYYDFFLFFFIKYEFMPEKNLLLFFWHVYEEGWKKIVTIFNYFSGKRNRRAIGIRAIPLCAKLISILIFNKSLPEIQFSLSERTFFRTKGYILTFSFRILFSFILIYLNFTSICMYLK